MTPAPRPHRRVPPTYLLAAAVLGGLGAWWLRGLRQPASVPAAAGEVPTAPEARAELDPERHTPAVLSETGLTLGRLTKLPPTDPAASLRRGPGTREVRGTIFDLLTLAPVADADVAFEDLATGERFSSAADSEGRYAARLGAGRAGYAVAVSHPDYAPGCLAERSPPLRTRSRSERSSLAAKAAGASRCGKLDPGPAGRRTVKDFALVPSRQPGE